MLAMLAVPLATRAHTTPTGGAIRQATRLDSDGKTTDARAILQQIIDTASEPRARAAAHRAMANEAARVCIVVGELLAMTYEKMGDEVKARAFHEKAYALATSHNSPAGFTRPYARRKLAR